MILKEGGKKGQLTIFVLIAIFVLAFVIIFFAVRGGVFQAKIPANLEPAYNAFLICIEDKTSLGIDVLESQGGYISLPEFEPGSGYMPFSSQLDFLGNAIPYWYYVSGNNIPKEQVPTKAEMEEQLAEFLKEEIKDCRFDEFYENGFEIYFGEAKPSVSIDNDKVSVSVDADLSVIKGDESFSIKNHRVAVNSNLGSLYNSAKKIYDYEQENLFLENYGVDTMRVYAPVDDVELTCSPKIWIAEEVFGDLQEALEVNTLLLKTKNEFSTEKDYFTIDLPVEHNVNFLTSKNWANAFEVLPSEGNVLIANPIGNQPGLGVLGFCYVPYHFVYNIKYPVLVQVFEGDEIFQFPLAVVIQGNKPREALDAEAVKTEVPELCNKRNTLYTVNSFDSNLNSIDADVSYECSGSVCYVGKTSNGEISAEFPQCVNGFVIAKAEGFEDAKYQQSIVESGSLNVVLNRLYEKNIELKLDGVDYNGQATVSFVSENGAKTIAYPEQKSVSLSDGQYEVRVYMYGSSSINIGATTKEQCVEVPQSGVGGFFGFTREKCYSIDFPAQIVSNALSGGGKQNYYVVESELEDSNVIEINAEGLPTPNSLEQLQNNYLLFEEKNLEIVFK